MLPHEYPKWQAVYFYFSRWKRDGTLEQIQARLVEQLRKKAGRHTEPTAAIIEAQSVKTTLVGGESRGFDAGKKVKGRKRHIIVDTLGLLLAVVIQSASVQDRDGADEVIERMKRCWRCVNKIFADGGYRGKLTKRLKRVFAIEVQIIKRNFLKGNEEKAKIPHGYKANLLNENVPLKLFVKCENCKENLRGYIVKAKNLYYYKCDNGSHCSCNVSAKKLHGLFETILDEVTLCEDYIDLYQLQLRKIYNTLNTEREEHLQQYKLKSKELKEKIERLEERYINEEIKADLYEKFSRKFKSEREEMETYVGMTTFSASNLEKFVKRSTEHIMDFPSVWTSSDYKSKQTLQFSIFPEGIHYSKKIDQPRTVKMNSVFTLSARQKGRVEENKTGTSELIFRNSGLVAPTDNLSHQITVILKKLCLIMSYK